MFLYLETPDVTILTTSTHEVTCLTTGYYPHGATVHWVRGKSHELVPQRMLVGGEELPNGDGTFQIRLTMRHMDEEEVEYKCRVEHSSLKRPVMRTLGEIKKRHRVCICLSVCDILWCCGILSPCLSIILLYRDTSVAIIQLPTRLPHLFLYLFNYCL